MSLARVLALLIMVLTCGVAFTTCVSMKEAGGTPWVILLVGCIISGLINNLSKPKGK